MPTIDDPFVRARHNHKVTYFTIETIQIKETHGLSDVNGWSAAPVHSPDAIRLRYYWQWHAQ